MADIGHTIVIDLGDNTFVDSFDWSEFFIAPAVLAAVETDTAALMAEQPEPPLADHTAPPVELGEPVPGAVDVILDDLTADQINAQALADIAMFNSDQFQSTLDDLAVQDAWFTANADLFVY
jgi:hypothetical protein